MFLPKSRVFLAVLCTAILWIAVESKEGGVITPGAQPQVEPHIRRRKPSRTQKTREQLNEDYINKLKVLGYYKDAAALELKYYPDRRTDPAPEEQPEKRPIERNLRPGTEPPKGPWIKDFRGPIPKYCNGRQIPPWW
eukprot:GHVU01103551.1.p2 GENE.GHVU01103551.1~~GHVU01103551.1.p2  ORF type:complete len:137 (-),score=4.47 GHVU01103551.1:997-1407(-)